MDSSGALYRLIEEVNERRTREGLCETMTIEEKRKAIEIFLSRPKSVKNRSINRFRSIVKKRLQEMFRKSGLFLAHHIASLSLVGEAITQNGLLTMAVKY